jgi:hypothetical protein
MKRFRIPGIHFDVQSVTLEADIEEARTAKILFHISGRMA